MKVSANTISGMIKKLIEIRHAFYKGLLVECIQQKDDTFTVNKCIMLASNTGVNLRFVFTKVKDGIPENDIIERDLLDCFNCDIFLESVKIGDFTLQYADLKLTNLDPENYSQENDNFIKGTDVFTTTIIEYLSLVIFMKWYTPIIFDPIKNMSLYNAVEHVNSVMKGIGFQFMVTKSERIITFSIMNTDHFQIVSHMSLATQAQYDDGVVKDMFRTFINREIKHFFYNEQNFSRIEVEV